jgi:hypothetical protein
MSTLVSEPLEPLRPAAVESLRPASEISWGSVVAGAIAAAAVSAVLLAFASAAGISLASTAPTWRDASFALWLLAGLFMLLVAMLSFAIGGYVAGRFRARALVTAVEDVEMRDGIHGLLAWGLAILIGAVLALAAANAAAPAMAPSGPAGASASVAGENLLAFEIDHLFRTLDQPSNAIAYRRAEAGRILLTTGSHKGMSSDDRLYLTDLVMAETRVPEAEAAARVSAAENRAHDALSRARTAAVLEAFMSAAALLAGAVCAWFAACAGGHDRERNLVPRWVTTRTRIV